MKRLLLLAPEIMSRGGVQSFMRSIWDAMRGCADQGFVPSLVALNDSTAAVASLPRDSLQGAVVGCARSKARFGLAALGMRHAEAVIVGHVGQAPVALLSRMLGGGPYAIILHGFEAWRRLGPMQRLACRNARLIVATTAYTAERFATANSIARDQIRVIPLCAQPQSQSASAKPFEGRYRILVVGRQLSSERYKGFPELIEAVAIMSGRGESPTLHVVGTGDDQAELKRQARERGIENDVIFHGALDEADLAAAYSGCHVFAMPSRDEGFGIVYLEAMRHSMPCVAAASGGAPEVVKDGVNGILVPYGDASALASALERLRDDVVLRRSLGDAGRQLVETIFSPAAFARGYRDLFADMSGGGGLPTRGLSAG
jgi:phosphatidylinositol alpha-1,6-mannosyltransferase